MANVDRPNGAVPVRRLDGGAVIPANLYEVDVTNTPGCFIGDFMTIEADGSIGPAINGTTNEILGVCVGVADDYGDLTRRHLPATTAGNVFVQDDPYCLFEAQDDASEASTLAHRGTNCPIVIGAGNATSGISGHEIGISGKVATLEQVRLVRLVNRPDNDYGSWSRWEILINEHQFNQEAGLGI